jgi:hypothetical protein
MLRALPWVRSVLLRTPEYRTYTPFENGTRQTLE